MPSITLITDTKLDLRIQPNGVADHIPKGVLRDQYGLLGLFSFLSGINEDPTSVELAIGEDLTTLGLDLLNQKRDLFSTFGGPWATRPCRPQDVDVEVPSEYLTNITVRNRLPSIKLNRLSDDVLFYLFYNFPGEVYQVAAACELYSREWRYHMSLHVWLTRSQHGGLKEQTASYERGSYNVFDPTQWRKVPKELKLEYKELEGRPSLPELLLHSSGNRCAETDSEDVSRNCL
uniref:CCR4-NOT transcription complex subunit 2 n=1 Tax=Ascaris suum TaxID=6253 RepID=F1L795_ASCSU